MVQIRKRPDLRRTRSVHVHRKHQEGALEQFGVKAIGVKKLVQTTAIRINQSVSVLVPGCLRGEIIFFSIQQAVPAVNHTITA